MTDWIVTSSVLIIVVTALRYLLRGTISLRLQYALWAIVLLRLLLPVQLGETSFSVLNAVEEDTELQLTVSRPFFFVGETPDLAMPVVEPDDSLSEEELTQLQQKLELQYYEEMSQYAMPVSLSTVLRVVWLTGTAVTAAWFFLSNLHFARVLRRSRRLTEHTCGNLPVYVSPPADTPCLFGLFHPAVYVTEAVLQDETVLHHVLSHEETHYRQGDHIWSVLRGVCLALHWYNPLVWLAAALSRRDAELACDEGTLRRLGEEQRTAYGETLIALTCGRKKGELLLTATTMTGSKKSLRERITLIAKRPKMAVYTLIAALLVVTVAAGCTFTGKKAPDSPDELAISYLGSEHVEAQVLSAVRTYIIAHAAIVNDLAEGGDLITAAEIHSIAPSLNSNTENGLCLYNVSYYLQYADPLLLDEISQSGEFAQKWQAEGTNGSAPVPNFFHSGFFQAAVIAPYSEAGQLPVVYTGSAENGQAAVTAKTYLRAHAEILQQLTPSATITDGEILSLTPIRLPHDALSPTIPYVLYYRLSAQDSDVLTETTTGQDFQLEWSQKNTGHPCPTAVEISAANETEQRADVFFSAILYAPRQDTFSVSMTNQHWSMPGEAKMAAAEYVLERAAAVQRQTGDPSLITGAEITRLQPISTGVASEFFSVQFYHLDYRLQLRDDEMLYTDLHSMTYSQEDGKLWLREHHDNGTPVLVVERRTQIDETRSRLSILYTGDVEQLYGGDYTKAARGIYESARNSTH